MAIGDVLHFIIAAELLLPSRHKTTRRMAINVLLESNDQLLN